MVRAERPSKICRSLSPGTFTFFRASDVTGKLTHHRTLQRNERIPRRRGGGESEGFDAPDEASGPGRGGAESGLLEQQKFGGRRVRLALQRQGIGAEKLGFVWRGILYGEDATGKSGVFPQFENFVIGVSAMRIKNHDAEGVARPAIVAKEALEAGFFDAGLFVNGSDGAGGGLSRGFAQARVIGLGAAEDRVDERGGRRAKIERGDGAAVIGFYKRLSFERGKEQLVGAVSIVVKELDTRRERAGRLAVRDRLGANQVAPRIGTKMRRIDSAEDAVPIGVVALGTQEQVASL